MNNLDPPYTPKNQQVEISAEDIYARLKQRIMAKLYEEPYENADGILIDPLPARDLASMSGVVLKMLKFERETLREDQVKVTIVPIPALPPIRKES